MLISITAEYQKYFDWWEIKIRNDRSMELQNFIFHTLETESGQKKVSVKPSDDEVSLPNGMAESLVDKAIRSFRKDRGRAHARFVSYGWLPQELVQLLAQQTSFKDLSLEALEELRREMFERVATSGGHLFVIRYTLDDAPYLMFLLLKDLDGYIISDQSLEESHILDIDKLHFAAQLDVNRWQDKNDDGAYVTFLKGSGRNEFSDYFKRFLCVDEESFIDPKTNTKALADAIIDYCHTHFKDEGIQQARHRVKQEIFRKINNGDLITLEGIAPFVDPDNPDRFCDFLVDSGYEIQPEFEAQKAYLKKLTVLSGKGNGVNISFESDLLNDTVVFEDSVDSKTPPKLIISNIPADLLYEIRQAEAETKLEAEVNEDIVEEFV